MTQTLSAAARRPRAPAPGPVPSLVPVAAFGALGAAALGLLTVTVVVLLAWFTASGGGATAPAALRTAADGWLLGHGVPLALPRGTLALPPLGLTLLPVLLLMRGGGWVARTAAVTTLGRSVQAALAMGATYGVLLALVAGAAGSREVRPSTTAALLGGWLMATCAGGAGVMRAAGTTKALLSRLPVRARALLAGTTAAVLGLVAAGAVVVGASLLAHADRALHLARALDAGAAGGLALCLLGVVYAPTAAVWGAGYALGPGFAVGVGTSVGPFATQVGSVPALPLLAGLPANGTGATWGLAALALPFVAGVAGGAVLARRGRWESPEQAALWGALIGPLTGVAVAVLSWVSAGPAGPDRFATVGPSWWQTGLAATAWVALAGAVGAWEMRRRLER